MSAVGAKSIGPSGTEMQNARGFQVRRWPVTLTLVAVCLAALPMAGATRRRAAGPSSHGMSEVRRVLMIIFENTDAAVAYAHPYLFELSQRGGALRNYHAVTHPSQPNYIAIAAGSTHGVLGSDAVTLSVPHLGDLLDARGLTWKVYAEDYPGDCFLGLTSGNYVRRHVPFLSFANVQKDPKRCRDAIVNASAFDADVATKNLPAFAMFIPDLLNDGHNTSVMFADAWLRGRFAPLFDDPVFMDGTLVILVFDEGSTTGPNIVYCVFYGAGVEPGTSTTTFYDHYSLLRTVEEIFHLGTLHQHDETADVISGIWRR